MGSTALTSTLGQRILPFQAILRHDLRTLRESWLVRLWLAGTAVLTLVVAAGNWGHFQIAPLVASLLFPYLVFPWFLVVMVLGVNPVSGSRVEALADGFLSRPVTRHEFLLAVWTSRVLIVLATYLVVMVPAVAIAVLAKRPAPAEQVTWYGVLAALVVVGLVLTFQVSLAFLLGTLLRRPLVAIVLLLFLWYPVNMVLHTLRMEALSPIRLSQALPTLLRQPWRSTEAAKDNLDDAQLDALKLQAANFLSVLAGGAPQRLPDKKDSFFEPKDCKDFSLLRVVLGYGVPTLLAVGLATLVFSLRDL